MSRKQIKYLLVFLTWLITCELIFQIAMTPIPFLQGATMTVLLAWSTYALQRDLLHTQSRK